MEIKYLYFEIKFIQTNEGRTKPTIENENILLIKPKTNRLGIWSFENMTDRFRDEEKKSYSVVRQYWIDLGKFNVGEKYENEYYKGFRENITEI